MTTRSSRKAKLSSLEEAVYAAAFVVARNEGRQYWHRHQMMGGDRPSNASIAAAALESARTALEEFQDAIKGK
jgi:hypothetical protein